MELERKDGCMVRVYPDPDTPSPRDDRSLGGCLGHLLSWANGIKSPDENPYNSPEELFAELIRDNFTLDELRKALKSELFARARLKTDKLGVEHLIVRDEYGWVPSFSFDVDPSLDMLADLLSRKKEAVALLKQKIVIKPLYRLEHSDVAYSTSDFGDRWDSGLVGLAYAAPDDVERWSGGAWSLSKPADRANIELMLDAEVEVYSCWANGDGFRIEVETPNGEYDNLGGILMPDYSEKDILRWSEEVMPLLKATA